MAVFNQWFRSALLMLTSALALASGIAWAQSNTRVTAGQVTAAILASPNASAQLQSYANAIGNLAMFESGGQLSVYNGSCCYGVLQMNTRNIATISPPVTPEQFRQLPLQQQVNAWATVMSDALRTGVPARLASMTTFDGRPVTPSLVLACVQLGVGNCQTMIRSGRCNGFADINGTDICEMADRIDGVTRPPSTNPTTPSTGTGWSVTPQTPGTALQNCLTDGHGNCLSMSQAIESGFESGSGFSMSELRNVIQMLTVAITFLICASMLLAMWKQFTDGRIASAELLMGVRQVTMVAGIILIVLTVA